MSKLKFFLILIGINILMIPSVYGYETGREVYVRHINRDTGEIITELSNVSQEIIYADGTQALISNGTSDDADILYSEYYNFDISATMNITKTLIVKANGTNYKYLGVNVCTRYSLDEAYEIMEQKKSAYRAGTGNLDISYDDTSATAQFTIKSSDSNDVTIIDFYYTSQSVTEISPRLLSNTNVWSGDDLALVSDITYVPAGGAVYPYFITPEYIIKDLSYEKVIENGNVYYTVNNFMVYRLESSYLKSSDTVNKDGVEISGHLVGSTNDTVFSGVNETLTLPVEDSTKASITSELSSLLANSKTRDIPSTNSLDTLVGANTSGSDYSTSGFMVDITKYNGLRSAKGNVVYTTYNVLSGETSSGFEMESTNEHFINVYTPIQLDTPEITVTNNTTVNHSNVSTSTVILADDATFQIKIKCIDSNFEYYNNIDDYTRAKFVDYYYLIFDFDVIHNGKTYTAGQVIRISNNAKYDSEGYTYFNATVASNETLSTDESTHKIIVIAAASNMPSSDLIQYIADQEVEIQVDGTRDVSERKYINDSGNNEVSFINDVSSAVSYNGSQYTNGYTLYADGYYFAMQTLTIRTASRIYDFKISDCTDLAYKSVFRNVASATDVNSLTGNYYYSGIRRLLVYTSNNKEYTTLLDRSDITINGTSSTKTLPLGPYKHTTATYISAPKLGYRIAFDLKTSGYYTAGTGSRKISIKPSYYYISKDGSTLIQDIDLYYKNSSGIYQKFEGSNYTIYFTPNDGYRYKSNSTTSNVSSLSTKLEALNIASSDGIFYLTDSMMSSDETGYIQSWYGEFKLPNTTIAVKAGDSPSNAITDGYIAVKFEITCIDSGLNETISYNTNNTSASSQTNTTQWDYEGYLGFSNLGQEVTSDTSLRLQLEKGIWSIDSQELYEFVKGTVVLFDTDDRASDDIQ